MGNFVMLELTFIDRETGRRRHALTGVTRVLYITTDKVGFDHDIDGPGSCELLPTDKLEVEQMQSKSTFNDRVRQEREAEQNR